MSTEQHEPTKKKVMLWKKVCKYCTLKSTKALTVANYCMCDGPSDKTEVVGHDGHLTAF